MTERTERRHIIHFVIGEIGGVGKSTFCKVLVERYLRLLGIKFKVVDCDRTNPNVGMAYDRRNYDPAEARKVKSLIADGRVAVVEAESRLSMRQLQFDALKATCDELREVKSVDESKENCDLLDIAISDLKSGEQLVGEAEQLLAEAQRQYDRNCQPIEDRIYFSEDLDDYSIPDRLVLLAREQDVIVNLPAQISGVFNGWVKESGLLTFIKEEENIDVVCWFVGKPTTLSIDLLKADHKFHDGRMKYVLVKNGMKYQGSTWEEIITPGVSSFLKDSKISQILMPNLILGKDERKILDDEQPPFHSLLGKDDERFSPSSKGRLSEFLKLTIAEIDRVNLIPPVEVVEEIAPESVIEATDPVESVDLDLASIDQEYPTS